MLSLSDNQGNFAIRTMCQRKAAGFWHSIFFCRRFYFLRKSLWSSFYSGEKGYKCFSLQLQLRTTQTKTATAFMQWNRKIMIYTSWSSRSRLSKNILFHMRLKNFFPCGLEPHVVRKSCLNSYHLVFNCVQLSIDLKRPKNASKEMEWKSKSYIKRWRHWK